MSVEAPKTVEETPAVMEKTAPTAVPAEPATTEVPTAETSEIPAATSTETPAMAESTPATDLAKGETVVEAQPASEGVLGYKEPGFLKQLRFSKHFFWFSDEPSTSESLTTYLRAEKSKVGHEHAAWARETGQGLLFYTKRQEDKASPSGILNLSDASNVAKEGLDVFSFKLGHHIHRFEAASSAERDSWVVAVETKVNQAKALKEELTGRESYKKNFEEYAKSSAHTGATTAAIRSKSKDPKTHEAIPATDGAADTTTSEPAFAAVTDGVVTSPAAEEQKKVPAKKDRSQSRKRTSIFGTLLGKKEHDDQKEVKKEEKEAVKEEKKAEKKEEKAEKKAEKKEEKKEEKAEKKAEKKEEKAEKKAEAEHIKEEKKIEAEHKKEEAKATHHTPAATEAVEAGAVAAAPVAAIAAVEHKHEDKTEKETETTTPTEKKAKRSSVFGNLFGKKGVTSPSAEKTEAEAGPVVPSKDSDIPPVSDTAPKIEEPIENKPIDTAAVTAPVDTIQTPAAAEEGPAEPAPTPATGETVTTPRTEKKNTFLGFIKGKKDHKEEVKEEKAAEEISKDPVAAASVEPTEPTAETPATTETAAATTPAKEERPAREKRRTSLFSGLGTLKKKPAATESSEADDTIAPETKREKSPLPAKLGGLFRRPSRAVKSETPKETTDATPAATESALTEGATADEHPATTSTGSSGQADTPTFYDSVTKAPEQVSAAA